MQQIEKKDLPVNRTARYFIIGKPGVHIRKVLFVLHGYGMNAGKFILKFNGLESNDTLIVAPEGLSRYYKNGFAGQVVASWMTSEDRSSEINDYLNFLDKLYDTLELTNQTKVHVLGFSQGASTASRWVMQGSKPIASLILWSGEFALDITKFNKSLNTIYNIVGKNDQFITIDQYQKQSKYIESKGFKVNSIEFDGDHNIYPDVLNPVWNELNLE